MAPSARDIIEKIKNSAAAKEKALSDGMDVPFNPTSQYPGLLPAEQVLIQQASEQQSLNKFIESNVIIPDNYYPDFFKDLGYVSKNQKEKKDFSDLEYKDEPAVTLTSLTDEQTCQLGNKVFSGLSSGITRSSVAAILVLAFQLKKQGFVDMGRVFPDSVPDEFDTSKDVEYHELDKTRIAYINSAIVIDERIEHSSGAKAYAFLSASMLRMFTRSPENFDKAWLHITQGFKTFYNVNFPLGDFKLGLEVLKDIHRQFSIDTLVKSTLFRILYMSNGSEDNESLKKFLFDLHLSHTGMHILPITIKLCDTLHCKAGLLLGFLWKGEYDRQIESMSRMISWIISSPSGKERAMWRYGRIFSQNFMSTLQAKTCPKLVYILAAALKHEKPKEHADILEIAQLREISASDKRKCGAGGKFLVKLVRKHVNRGSSGSVEGF